MLFQELWLQLEWVDGTILILLLNLFQSIDQHMIQGINLVFFIPTSIVAIYMNVKHKSIDYKIATVIIIFGVVGAIVRKFVVVSY